jgi:hypothetical protein
MHTRACDVLQIVGLAFKLNEPTASYFAVNRASFVLELNTVFTRSIVVRLDRIPESL